MAEPEPDPTQQPASAPDSERDSRTWAMLCHITAFAGFVFPLGNVFGPLIIWLIKKDQYPLVDDQGKESLNFQISVSLYVIVSVVLMFVLIGIPMLIAVGIFDIVVVILAAVKANDGVPYRYPLNIRFIS